MIEIFTDGSARGNPGPGGYGIVMRYKQHYKELSQGYRHTTNNRMELLAVIVALESLKKAGSILRRSGLLMSYRVPYRQLHKCLCR